MTRLRWFELSPVEVSVLEHLLKAALRVAVDIQPGMRAALEELQAKLATGGVKLDIVDAATFLPEEPHDG